MRGITQGNIEVGQPGGQVPVPQDFRLLKGNGGIVFVRQVDKVVEISKSQKYSSGRYRHDSCLSVQRSNVRVFADQQNPTKAPLLQIREFSEKLRGDIRCNIGSMDKMTIDQSKIEHSGY